MLLEWKGSKKTGIRVGFQKAEKMLKRPIKPSVMVVRPTYSEIVEYA